MEDANTINVDIKEFDFSTMSKSCAWIIVGEPGSGKSTLIENMVYYTRHKYPVGRVFHGSDDKRFYRDTFGDLFCNAVYDEDDVKRYIKRAQICNEDNVPMSQSILVIDDCADDIKIFKTKTISQLFRIGPQHYNSLTVFGVQHSMDFPPAIRNSASYVALFYVQNIDERKKIYRNFGGIFKTFDMFCQFMDGITSEKYTCLIIRKLHGTVNVQDNVFYYKTNNKLPRIQLGCDEFKRWNKERYDNEYREEFII